MHDQPSSRLSRRTILIGGVGLLAVLAAIALILWRTTMPESSSNPTLIDGSRASSAGIASGVAVVETSPGGGGSTAGKSGLRFRLSQGNPEPQSVAPLPVTAGEPLDPARVDAILARLPALPPTAVDAVDFRVPEDVLPPPRPGETIAEPFPPPPADVSPPDVPTGPLQVLRFAPEGEVLLAPFVNVTFNQPMVPLTALDDLAALDVPVRLEPDLPGTWKWIGTRTLRFEADPTAADRLPMATEFVATVPAGTASTTGGVLAEAVTWRFRTPPPRLISSSPGGGPHPLDPLVFLQFDQRVDPDAVLATVRLTADGDAVSVRLASADEVAADETVKRLAETAGEGRWVAFRAAAPLPADTGVTVDVGPGTPSAEGPLRTEAAQSFSFRTYAPLGIVDHGCSWSRSECPPLTPFFIRFNNPIDVDAYAESMIRIEPALPGATIGVYGDTISIQGNTKGRTTYRVVVAGALQDTFGQTLGQDHSLRFPVGSAEPFLSGPDQALITLDPAARRPVFSVYAINYSRLSVRVYRVQPSHWPAYQAYLRDFFRVESPPAPPGQLAFDETITLEAAADALTEGVIDLSRALDGESGQLIVLVEPAPGQRPARRDWRQDVVQTWVQVTGIGLDAFADHSQMVVWATDLANGAPLADVTITAGGSPVEARTDGNGVARLALDGSGIATLIATRGTDTAILPRSPYAWGDDRWRARPVQDELRWMLFDDRAMYRPGETVHVKGFVRRVGGTQSGDVGPVNGAVSAIRYRVIDPQGNNLLNGTAEVGGLGGFDFRFELPENTNLGYGQITIEAQGNLANLQNRQAYHSFQIQEFRRPEFEVTARNETTGPYLVGDYAVVAVSAQYFTGGALPNADVNWLVSSTPGSYSPPNWPDFTFGKWVPWWFFYEESSFGPSFEETTTESFAGTTDATGQHFLRLDFDEAAEPRPVSLSAEATVFDVNRQAWSARTSLLVHPADRYVGLRSAATFVEQGTPLVIDLIVTDLDGQAQAGHPIEVQAARLVWQFRQGSWREEATDVQTCTLTSAAEPVSCTFETPAGGQMRITATVTDAAGRQNQSELTRWVSGGQRPPARRVEQEQLTLIPDKASYQPGETARILVQAPFAPAEGLLTLSRSGIVRTERFSLPDGTATLAIPIEMTYIPNLNVQVDVVGSAPRSDDAGEPLEDAPPRPAYATGGLQLSVPPLQRTLTLEATPRQTELAPGEETVLDLRLVDATGEPVAGAELAVVVVDEAILALTNYRLPNPIDIFYTWRSGDVDSRYGRASIILANPAALAGRLSAGGAVTVQATRVVAEAEEVVMEMAAMAPAPAALDEAAGDGAEPIRVRTDFNPLALFAPTVRTGADGRAEVTVKLPDNLTRYRVMVVAADQTNRFGQAEANLTARLPLMVRPSPPRFLNFGDRFELPIVVQNQTDEPLTVDVAVRAGNLTLTDGPGRRVTVPANDRVEVRFPAITGLPGTAGVQVAAVAGAFADAATFSFPVYTPATTEAFATYGVLDEGAVAQAVVAPSNVFPQFGGLEITTSSTALQALTDAVLYLTAYPYECSEQLASRVLAIAALRDVLSAFSAQGLPGPAELEAAVARDIERLRGLQNDDGGFPYWQRGRESIPFHTIHVAHALERAEAKGFAVPAEMKGRALAYLRDIESHYPSYYSKRTRETLSAYALYVRAQMGDTDATKARRLLNDAGLENLSLEAVAWLWQTLVDDPGSAAERAAITRHLNNRAVETPSAANFTTSYGDDAYLLLASDRRADAVILDALIAGDPANDLIPKVVNGLLAHRTRGHWGNTQENVFVLLALDRYFQTFEAQTPDFVAGIWLGDTYAGSHAFAGRTTERHETTVPMALLMEAAPAGAPEDLILSKDGPGRLYYRLGLRYAPTDLDLPPLDMGFVVQRSYEAVDDPGDVARLEDGTWQIKAGARVRVRLTMVADNRRYHVALVDPLPAGLEIINPGLAVAGSIPQDPASPDYRQGWWWWGPWYEHQNLRDERAEAFTPLLWEGTYTYTYVARATTPGTFVVPPAKAEEMYAPEVFGRSAADLVIVR